MPRVSTRKKAQPATDTSSSTAKKIIYTSQTDTKTTPSIRKRKETTYKEDSDIECASCAEEEEEEEEADTKPSKRRKTASTKSKGSAKTATKADKSNGMPLAPRTAVSSLKRALYIGAHVSSAGGVQNSVTNALDIGANAFALFLKSQRKWESPPLADDARTGFISAAKDHSYDAASYVLPHGSYLVNLAQADATKAKQAYSNFVDDLGRCHRLGIRLYNFHPGNTGGAPRSEACARIAAQLNRAHKEEETGSVITVLENMAGQGNTIGTRFEDLRDIIQGVEDKSRVGVCIDTCHAFAAGYDLRTQEALETTMDEFNRVVGMQYLMAFHLNDSKAPFSSHRDLHANIGTGFLGLRAFHALVNHAPFQNLPMVLETPIDRKGPNGKVTEDKKVWADEIKLLESMIGMDADNYEFKKLETELQAKGADERTKIQEQVDKKADKDAKKGSGKGTGGRSK